MKATFQEALREIRNRVDILSVVSKYLSLKKAGSSYVAVCPFHNDKSPSMHVSPSKEIYKCFSCGASGDMFKFLIDYRKSSFSEVVHELANEIGIEIIKSNSTGMELPRKHKLILQMNELAAKFFSSQLTETEEGQKTHEYLKENRKLTETTIKDFQLGFSPQSKTALLSHIQHQMVDCEETKDPSFLVESGLFVLDRQTELPIDRFRGRLMIPIQDSENQFIAFGARALDIFSDNSGSKNSSIQPKYLNSPETPVYHKSRHLFGYNKARSVSRERKKILLLEGYFDVIQAHQNGIDYAVGSLGTALTKEQASMLYQATLTRQIILGFDSDDAGQRALKSSLHVFQEGGFKQKLDLRMLKLKEAKDIDEYLIKNSTNEDSESFDLVIEDSPEVYESLIETIAESCNLEMAGERTEAINNVAELIFDVQDPVQRELMAEKAAQALDFDKSTILQLIHKKQSQKPSTNSNINSGAGFNQKPNSGKSINFSPFKKKFKKGSKSISPINKQVANDVERTLVSILLLTNDKDSIERIKSVELKDEIASLSRKEFLDLSDEEKKNILENKEDARQFEEQEKVESVIELSRWNYQSSSARKNGENHQNLLEDCLKKLNLSNLYSSWEKSVKNKKANII